MSCVFLILWHKPASHSQKQTVREKSSRNSRWRGENYDDNLSHCSPAALVLKGMPLFNLTAKHEKYHAKENATSCIFHNNKGCPLKSYEMDKLLENDQGLGAYTQQNLSIYYTRIRHCNSKIVEVRKAIKNTTRQNKSSWRISWWHYKAITDQQKTKTEVFLNDHAFSSESSGLNLTEMDRSYIWFMFICVQLFWLICLLTFHKLEASLFLCLFLYAY